jgi:type II secretory pathway pseudopilin PulG
MTLLEIMIVLAIIALVMGLVIVPKVMNSLTDAETETAHLQVMRFAEQDYPRWVLSHQAQCPNALAELNGGHRAVDPWHTDYKMYCGATAPAPEVAFGAASFGKDRLENTGDDIRSWGDD